MQVNLDHTHIFSSDVAATIGFFSEMFGATVVWDETVGGVRNIRLAIGHGFLHLYDQPPRSDRAGIVHHIGIETDDLDALVARMAARGFTLRNPIREQPKYRYAMVAAPDNLLIELFQCDEPERWGITR